MSTVDVLSCRPLTIHTCHENGHLKRQHFSKSFFCHPPITQPSYLSPTCDLCLSQGDCPGDILNSNFTNNIAQQAGGAHWINVAPTLTVYGNSYIANNASTGSAGIFAQAVVSSTFSQLRFGNNVGEKGAALFQGSCNATMISNCTFYNNKATTFGGAVFRCACLTAAYWPTNAELRFCCTNSPQIACGSGSLPAVHYLTAFWCVCIDGMLCLLDHCICILATAALRLNVSYLFEFYCEVVQEDS